MCQDWLKNYQLQHLQLLLANSYVVFLHLQLHSSVYESKVHQMTDIKLVTTISVTVLQNTKIVKSYIVTQKNKS